MDGRTRASSAASKSLLSRQLASIADTLARASQRRDEEVKRSCRPSRTSTATANPTSPKKSKVPTPPAEPCYGQPIPAAVFLRGGGDDDENADPHHITRLEQREKAGAIRRERKEFEKLVAGSRPDDPEREVITFLAQTRDLRIDAVKDITRARLKEEEEKAPGDERLIKREEEVEEFEEQMLKKEDDMEDEDYKQRLRMWEEGRRLNLRMRAKGWARQTRTEFLIKTNHEAQFKDPEREQAELKRLEEEFYQRLVTHEEAQDAREVDVERERQRCEEVDEEDNQRFKLGESPEDFAMALSSDDEDDDEDDEQNKEQNDKHPTLVMPHLRGGAGIDRRAVSLERRGLENEALERMATRAETEGAQHEAAKTSEAEEERRRTATAERRRKIDEDFHEMMARQEEKDCERLEAEQRRRVEVQRTNVEEAMRDMSAQEELRRREPVVQPEAERCYTLPPESPPNHSPPSYAASEFEARGGDASYYDAILQAITRGDMLDDTRGGMRGGHATPLDDDSAALLAELSSLSEAIHLSEAEDSDAAHEGEDSRQMLAEFDRPALPTRAIATTYNDPREMLEELLTLSAPGPQELRSPTSEDFEDDEDDDVNALRARLERLRPSSDRSAPSAPVSVGLDEGKTETTISADLPPEAIPYIVALELERSGCEWEVVQRWTRCLFSSGLASYEVQRDKEIAVAHAEAALQKTIASVMEAEEENQRKEEETKLQRRLIVSNLAAGADTEEMECQFWQYRYDMQVPIAPLAATQSANRNSLAITLLPERDPLKRTQTAHVDFASRKTAVQASYMSGQVYGLIFDVKLAVPVTCISG
ncbi:hypothetical protein N0V86_004459 [Didymella sp. IMI 355093]|nr:hypothetical protein N0V86_004459 [Didymella sp. IMI 355093]